MTKERDIEEISHQEEDALIVEAEVTMQETARKEEEVVAQEAEIIEDIDILDQVPEADTTIKDDIQDHQADPARDPALFQDQDHPGDPTEEEMIEKTQEAQVQENQITKAKVKAKARAKAIEVQAKNE